jgi:hypothetical protein
MIPVFWIAPELRTNRRLTRAIASALLVWLVVRIGHPASTRHDQKKGCIKE